MHCTHQQQYGKVNYVQPSDPICLNVTTNAPIGSAPAPEAAAKMICGERV
jgi:hypothetical protein